MVNNTGMHGLAIALSEAAQAALLALASISTRHSNARLMGTTVDFNFVKVYAPTLNTAEEAID